ncbi:MAG: TetR family transcriptional regulator, partial [Zoogloea sp.]|nr:TetR family transcriptional regulator [Zoogloea sp.]
MARKTKAEAEQTRRDILDAARAVFHSRGVGCASLDEIAKAAGVTRGAVYWHFANKTELFFALRDDIQLPLVDRVDDKLLSETSADPLDAVELALAEFFLVLGQDTAVREIFEIMFFRCEYLDEFSTVLTQLHGGCDELVNKLTVAYSRAKEKGLLCDGGDPAMLAWDSGMFISGLLKQWLADNESLRIRPMTGALIAAHVN